MHVSPSVFRCGKLGQRCGAGEPMPLHWPLAVLCQWNPGFPFVVNETFHSCIYARSIVFPLSVMVGILPVVPRRPTTVRIGRTGHWWLRSKLEFWLTYKTKNTIEWMYQVWANKRMGHVSYMQVGHTNGIMHGDSPPHGAVSILRPSQMTKWK